MFHPHERKQRAMTVQVTTVDDEGADGAELLRATPGLVVLADRPADTASLTTSVLDAPVSMPVPPDTAAREGAIEDLLRLLEASRRLQATLAANDATCEASVRKMMDGMAPAAVLADIDVAGARIDLSDSLGVFERARHRSRSTFIAAQFENGMNMKEIGRNWAISRQLAHRFYREARRDG
jgi:hypothetical protein